MSCPKLLVSEGIRLEEYLYMVEAISNNFNSEKVKNVRDSDIFGHLCYELVSCAQRFDPNKGSFEKYLSSHLFNKAIDFFRKKNRKKRQCTFVDQEALNYAFKQDESDQHISIELLPELLSESPKDSDRDKEDRLILVEHYLGGKSVLELSKKYKTTRVTIYNRIKKSIQKIREHHCLTACDLGGSKA